MKKEEILEKSRKENKNKDVYEQEVLKQSGTIAYTVMVILAGIFFSVQIFTGGGINYGFYAIIFAGPGAMFWVKWFRLRKKHEWVLALFYTIAVIAFSAAHIYNLVTTSTSL